MKSIGLPLSALIFIFLAMQLSMGCQQGPPKNSRAAQALAGQKTFNDQCAQCHGSEDVQASIDTLATQPPDLKLIMKRRRAKEFPVAEIARIIDGRLLVKAHGPREMPVWGEVYEAQGLDDEEIRGRKGELVAYLMSIQEM